MLLSYSVVCYIVLYEQVRGVHGPGRGGGLTRDDVYLKIKIKMSNLKIKMSSLKIKMSNTKITMSNLKIKRPW